MENDITLIRNFCIVAHIDHGKSTLADRFIELSHIVEERDLKEQILDSMDIERERGITIKSQAVTIPLDGRDGKKYTLNLVDTPGHVDFTYEVSRAIASCEGALLLIDATQGVEAQTLANMYLAMEHELTVVPVINKIDLPSADISRVKHMIDHDLGLDPDISVLVSAKTGQGVADLIEKVIELIPSPKGSPSEPLKALIFDSHYDPYRGVVIHIRLFDGILRPGDVVTFWSNPVEYKVEETGIFRLNLQKTAYLTAGEVGYMIAGIKNISNVRVGDTITHAGRRCVQALPGFRDIKPVVFSSVYPVITDDYEELSDALEKLKLNDASLIYEKDSSAALGFGYRCGFLGLLHLEVVQERLEREFGLSLVLTAPSVRYRVIMKKGEVRLIDNPVNYPDEAEIDYTEEPYIKASVITPSDFLGGIFALCMEKRGIQTSMNYLDEKRVELTYDLPLAEVLFDFYDRLKSVSRGYASFDYALTDYRKTDLVKVDILLNGSVVDALSMLIYREHARQKAKKICERLKDEIPRHQFKIPIQGAIGSAIIARETISALRKDVTAKCYGGDITRKRKLLEKQKEGKKKMKMIGNVELPQSAFLSVLRTND